MAITNYSELKTAVAGWMNRSNLDSEIPDFIRLTEINLSRWLRTGWLEKTAYTTSETFISLPTDYLQIRDIQLDYDDLRYTLEQVTPKQIDQIVPRNTTGIPAYYAIHAGNIELRPAPEGESEIRMTYYFKPTELSDSNTTNEYLDNAPDLMLAGACLEAATYTKDQGGLVYWASRFDLIKQQLLDADNGYSWSGEVMMRAG